MKYIFINDIQQHIWFPTIIKGNNNIELATELLHNLKEDFNEFMKTKNEDYENDYDEFNKICEDYKTTIAKLENKINTNSRIPIKDLSIKVDHNCGYFKTTKIYVGKKGLITGFNEISPEMQAEDFFDCDIKEVQENDVFDELKGNLEELSGDY